MSNHSTHTHVIAQALCAGDVFTHVRAVSGQAARVGQAHICVRFGSLLFYLEDREALDALSRAVSRAQTFADRVFGPVQDGFTRAEARQRLAFERGRLSADQMRHGA